MQVESSAVRVAVVGAGYWGKNLVRNFREIGSLAVVCDRDPSVEALCRGGDGDVRYEADFAALLADPQINAVALATPAVTHYEMASAALIAGKDVFVEKPLAVELSDGERLVATAQERRRVLMVGHVLRYHPAILKIQELVRDGALGKIQYVYSNRLNIGKIRSEENILWSFAPHDISVILALLGESPGKVFCRGAAYLNRQVFDVTMSYLDFPSGVQAHIFVSWLHPVKEQKLVVVGSEKMAVFDDTSDDKLLLYPHRVEWRNRIPTAIKAAAEIVPLEQREPLRAECEHFVDCVRTRRDPVTDGSEGLRVLEVLDACQRSLLKGGTIIETRHQRVAGRQLPYFVHPSAFVDQGAQIGAGTKIWHFSHVMPGARVGSNCVLGQNVNVDGGAVIGNNVKIQNNVSVYSGVTLEDDVFLGPSCVLTNVSNPRSQVNRHAIYEKTTLKRGSTVGANATIICGVTLGRYAFVAAGSVLTTNAPDYALMVGNPARRVGWMSRHGHRLGTPDATGVMSCGESGLRFQEVEPGMLRCLDLDEDADLPRELATGSGPYRQFRKAAAAD
jgi:UDP-2-acetamido-3-amino-2,3-dideoxy-glucuronate N-acetyltransferase